MTHHEKMVLTYYKQVDTECPTIALYSRNLNLLYLDSGLDPCYCREAHIDQIQRILLRKNKANVLLTGVSGCGKTALVEGVAAQMTKHWQVLCLMVVMQLAWCSFSRFWKGSSKMLQNNLNNSEQYATMTKNRGI